MQSENRKLEDQMEDIKDEQSRYFMLFDGQRKSFQDLQNKVAWNKFTLDEMKKVTEDVHVTVNLVQDLDEYVHRVLPINLQTSIYKSCMMSGDMRNRQRFERYTSDVINQLLLIKNEKSLKFDKKEVSLPKISTIEKQLALQVPTSPTSPLNVPEAKPTKFDMSKAAEEVKHQEKIEKDLKKRDVSKML